jgi:polar amino acid transport system substrate-binding protein
VSVRLWARRAAAPVVALAMLAMSACAPATVPTASTSAVSLADCTPAKLHTHTPGVLTVAVEQGLIVPWYVGGDPKARQGFEDVFAYELANKLGFDQAHVTWVWQSFDAVIAPGSTAAKQWDLDINNFTITPEREKIVTFSKPYYDDAQAVVAVKGSPLHGLDSISGLRDVKLGVEAGTTSETAIKNVIKPDSDPLRYNNHGDVVNALRNRVITAMVTDVPTAVNVAQFQGIDGEVIGRLPGSEQFGAVMQLGSPLKSCVDWAITELQNNGTMRSLEQTWLEVVTDSVPLLK